VLSRFEIPAGEGIRVDSGYESGSTVSTFYDAMLAKVVCHAPTRGAAARKLADTLARSRIHGVVTNRDLLVQVLRSEAFVAGEVSTAFLSEGLVTGLRPSSTGGVVSDASAAPAGRSRTRT
jgi:propionyl-CoA carboxylase alpha chain